MLEACANAGRAGHVALDRGGVQETISGSSCDCAEAARDAAARAAESEMKCLRAMLIV